MEIVQHLVRSQIEQGIFDIRRDVQHYFPKSDKSIRISVFFDNESFAKDVNLTGWKHGTPMLAGLRKWYKKHSVTTDDKLVIEILGNNEYRLSILKRNSVGPLEKHEELAAKKYINRDRALLERLLVGPAGLSEVKQKLGIPDSCEPRRRAYLDSILQDNLKDLQFGGLIERSNGTYALSKKGRMVLESLFDKMGELERDVAEMVLFRLLKPKYLFMPSGHLYLYPSESTYLRPPWINKLSLPLKKEDEALRDFLVRVYIDSVTKLLDKIRGELSFQEIRCAWQLTKSVEDRREGLIFNFNNAWTTYINDETRRFLDGRGWTQEKIFIILKDLSLR